MILQNLVLPGKGCPSEELYVRRSAVSGRIDFCTYFNVFSLARWKRYTTVSNVFLDIELDGKGLLELVDVDRGNVFYSAKCGGLFRVPLSNGSPGLIGVRLSLTEGSKFVRGCFGTCSSPAAVPTIALDMCTYSRPAEALEKINGFKESLKRFGKDYAKHVRMIVVDNGSSLEEDPSVKIVKSRNLGGSGGFARGLYEARHSIQGLTHIIFMDDDIVLDFESVYRIYSLLCFIRPSYSEHMIAGTMLDLNDPVRIYEVGKILPENRSVGNGLDVSSIEGISECESLGDIHAGGWWFFCSPYVGSDDYPAPLFLGYDDLLYSHVHGSKVISMTGIGVWHPALDKRYSPSRLFYYDLRNSVLFDILTGHGSRNIVLHWFRFGIVEILCMRPRNARLIAMAFDDLCEGMKVLEDPEEKNKAVESISYKVDLNNMPVIDAVEQSVNNRAWTVLTLNGQLLPSRGVGKTSKVSYETRHSYRKERVLHCDEGSGWFFTEKDAFDSIRTVLSLVRSSAGLYVRYGRVRKRISEGLKLDSESDWERIFGG